MMTTARQRKKVTRTSFEKKEVKAGLENSAKLEDVTNLTSAARDALHPEAESAFEVLKVAVKECPSFKNTSFTKVENRMSWTRALLCTRTSVSYWPASAYDNRSTRGQAHSAHNLHDREGTRNAGRIISNILTFEADGPIFDSNLMLFQ